MLIAFGGVLQATADIEANKAIALRVVELWNTGNLAIADEIFSSDFVNHDPNRPDVTELKSYKGWVVECRTAWPDFHVEDHDLVAEGDKVVARWTVTATHKGEFMGIPPTGKQGTVTGMHIYRFVDGKIVEHWWAWDVLGMLQQLGVVPAMGSVDFTWGEPSEVTGAPGDPEENKAIVRRAIDEIFNQGKLEVVNEVISAEYIRHDPTNSIRGTDGYKQLATGLLTAFANFRFTIEDIIAEEDKVAVRTTATGTHEGDYMGIPPTGKQVTVTGIYIVRLADGKNVEDWNSSDNLGLLLQLGVIPPMKPADTEANKAIVLRGVELWNTGNLAIADEIFAADLVDHSLIDLKSYKGYVVAVRAAFPDFHLEVHDIVAEGDKVVCRWTHTGTQKGEYMGVPPTGKQITVTGMKILRFAGGKIVEIWWSSDNLGSLQQLGVVPAMGSVDFTWGEPSKVTGAPGDPEKNKAIALRGADEIWNQGKLEVVNEVIATDYIYHNPTNSIRGTDGYKQLVTMMRSAFPDFRFTTVEDIIAEGDKVAFRWTATGTQKGEYMGIPPTGKQVTMTAIMIERFADGKVVEDWESLDNLGMLQQLGVIPSMMPKDYSNVFFMPLTPGLNMVSLPLEPRTPYTARTFAETLSATTVIKLDEKRQRFVGFTLDAPDDGFRIEGGKGYIVNVPKGGMAAFVGAAWTQPPMPAAPTVQTDGAWAFVVSGRILECENSVFAVTVRNTRTNAVATDVVRSGYFAAAFADLTRKNVVQTGDRLEIQVQDQSGEIASETFTYTVTDESIRQAFLPITIKNVGVPRQSLLLQNYPNPFNPETWIPYQLREPAEVVIRIYNANGQLVRTLSLGQRSAGFYLGRTKAAYWDGHNDAGEKVASGIYFYQIKAGDFKATRKMLIVK
jgi:steroid delta-isomerase-like uncharacterized protein